MTRVRSGRRVLVTGAAGLIGRSVVARLAATDHEVIAIHRSGVPCGLQRAATWLELDLTAPGAAAAIAAASPEVIVHGAAALPSSFDGDAARDAAAANRTMDAAVVGAANCRTIYLSSVSVYGFGPDTFTEDGPLSPLGPYAEAKLAGEQLVAESDDHAILRVSAPYGPGQTAGSVLRLFISQALAGSPLRYHGSGSRSQDFVAAADVATAVAAMVTAIDAPSGVYNVTSGAPISMVDLATLVVRETGSGSDIGPSGEPDPQEHHRARYDVGRIGDAVPGWPPTDLADGIRTWATTMPPRLDGERP